MSMLSVLSINLTFSRFLLFLADHVTGFILEMRHFLLSLPRSRFPRRRSWGLSRVTSPNALPTLMLYPVYTYCSFKIVSRQ